MPVGDGSFWPSVDKAAAEFRREARFGKPNALVLAGYADAYWALVNAPRTKRDLVVRGLRAAAKRLNTSDAADE